ncbi:SORC2-like protein [Mya arenaria]|uniref:SORC2-like protein n=1 Tax=Mya arenaria TaxID=6604 RepID=A0ABY7FHY2_MYAAR|nr:SORC2-like protein [Mya arenaria]
MARGVKIACVVFLCSVCNTCVYSKVFSRSMHEISNIQKPSLNLYEQGILNRIKRAQNSNSSFTTDNVYNADNFHSQNSSVTTTEILLTESNEVYVHWSGLKNETVFVLTRQQRAGQVLSSTLWRSADAGATFTIVHFDQNILVNHLVTAPADRTKTVLSDLANRRLAVTSDSGATWSTVDIPFAPHRLLLHPRDAGLILGYDLRELKLYVSENFGRTWTLLQERVTERFFWAVPDVDLDMRTVHMEVQDPVGPVTYYACTVPTCEPLPINNTLGTIDFYSLVVEGDYIFVQKSTDDVTSFYVSYKRGPFRKAYLPTDMQALDYNVVESDDGQVFLAVDYEGGSANLYLSDITGQFFVLSQHNVVGLRYPGKFDVDLVQVEGLRGVYLVNKFEAPISDMALLSQRTYITHNKGGRWRLMDAPEETREQCAQPELCNLHLHLGFTNTYLSIPLVETTATAPGLLVAHGTTGAFLDIATSHVFVSRDAGLTWTPAPFHGNHFLSILDQGGVIAAISADSVPTNIVHISTSEGQTWVSQNFSETMLTVDGFVNEPGSRSLITSLFGHRSGAAGWSLMQLNYTALLERPCTEEDFELWTPKTSKQSSGQNCIMGESLEIERKKTTSNCYVGRDYLRKKSPKTCACAAEDFECDFGYEYGPDGTSCVASSWFNPDSLPEQICRHGKYNKSAGYRKVASSACSGGDVAAFLPVETDCPLLPPRGLLITTAKSCVQRGANVIFNLRQVSGSETETEYTWTFGSQVAPLKFRGLSEAASVTRAFSTAGRINVTVTAVNGKGRANATITITVEDEIRSILVEIPWGARTDTPSFFNVTVLGDDNHTDWNQENSLHFVWEFKNKVTGSIRQLTWQNVIQQQFQEPGQYTFTLNVYNSVSSVFYTQDMTVYDSRNSSDTDHHVGAANPAGRRGHHSSSAQIRKQRAGNAPVRTGSEAVATPPPEETTTPEKSLSSHV